MGERKLTVRERIIIHLAAFTRYSEEFECPEGMSQAGISESIGKSRAHTTLELNRMKEAGLVAERLAHVRNAKSKRKTYNLTPEALAIEDRMVEMIRRMEINISGDEGGTVNGMRAVEILMEKIPVSRVGAFLIVLDSDRTIDMDAERRIIASAGAATPQESQGVGSRTFDGLILRANILSRKGRPGEALAVLDGADAGDLSHIESSRLKYSRASIFRKMGDYASGSREIDAALAAAKDSGSRLMVARCQMEKAMILAASGGDAPYLELLDSAEEAFRHMDSQMDLLRCGINQGIILRSTGNLEEAVSVLEDSLELAERTNQDRLRAYALVNLTDLLNRQGKYRRSVEMAVSAGDIFQVLEEPLMLAASLFNLGEAQAALGEGDDAIRNLENAISILEENGISRPGWLRRYAAILEEFDEPEKALAILKKIE